MDIDEIIHWLKEMQSPAISEAELYCAGSCYGQGDKAYLYPEDYVLDEAINALEQLKEYRKLEKQNWVSILKELHKLKELRGRENE